MTFAKDLTSFLANPPHIRVNIACTVNCHPCEEVWSWFSTKEFNEQKNKVGTCLKKAIIFLKSLIKKQLCDLDTPENESKTNCRKEFDRLDIFTWI